MGAAGRVGQTDGDRLDLGEIAKAPELADLLVSYLEQIGVEYVFGIPGGAVEPLYNALARSERRGGPRHVLARHETGAAFMADGYARETGKLGVCCATSGPGATNLITGVANAFDNAIPMLVITGQPALPAFGRNPLQESACTGINTLGMFRHCTRYNSLVSHPKQLEAKLIGALQKATRAPCGPVHLSVPVDVFRSPSPHLKPSYDLRSVLLPSSMIDDDAVRELESRVCSAKKIVLLIGGWCGEAIALILQFAALNSATFVTTPDGKGLVNPRHPLFRGVFGFGGHAYADAALDDPSVDLIIAVGSSVGEWSSGGWSKLLLNDRLVHIDESEDHFLHTPMAQLHVRGRILTVFERLLERLQSRQKPLSLVSSGSREERLGPVALLERQSPWEPETMLADWEHYVSDAKPITPQRLMRELGRRFPFNTHYLADTGNSVAWATHYLHPADRRLAERRLSGSGRRAVAGRRESVGGWLRVTMNFAPMGWAIGGAVGTALGNPGIPVVCIAGDGSMLMNGQEISVAVAESLTVIFVVLNDQSLGMVKHGQRLAGAEQVGVMMPPTDFAAMARAMGADAYTVRGPEDFEAMDIDAICLRKGPTLIDVCIDPEQVPPMGVRMKVLNEKVKL